MSGDPGVWARYRLRLRRKRLLWRALRARRALMPVADRTDRIERGTILCFSTVRNEAERLPWFLDHYRAMGVGHFLFVDNGSVDGTANLLTDQPDVSLWRCDQSYRGSRFGMDWLGWLLIRHGHGHWCLTVDADELLVFPHWPDRTLNDLTGWLDRHGVDSFGAMMLDLYPQGRLSQARYQAGTDPTDILCWFDARNYTRTPIPRYGATSIRGGVRKRVFFRDNPDLAPHLHKVPLVRWNRRFAYLSSTHVVLPRRLNAVFETRNGAPSGVLLHTKFLDQVLEKSAEEKRRREHFTHAQNYDAYYDEVIADPVLWDESSVRWTGPEQLETLGLLSRGKWD